MHLPDLNVLGRGGDPPVPRVLRARGSNATPTCWPCRPTASGDTLPERFGHQWLLNEAGALRVAFVDPGATIFGSPGPDGAPAPEGYVYAFNYDAMSYAIDEGAAPRHGHALRLLRAGLAAQRHGLLAGGPALAGLVREVLLRGRLRRAGPRPGRHLRAAADPHRPGRLPGDPRAGGLPAAVVLVGDRRRPAGHARSPGPPSSRAATCASASRTTAATDQPTNLELVEEAVRLCAEVGRPVATPTQAVDVLGLPALIS